METTNPSATKSKKPIVLAIVGVAIVAAGLIAMQTGVLAKLTGGLFGPPQVSLAETYSKTGTATFDHSSFDELLKAHVDGDGFVDYAAFKNDIAKLDAYIDTIKTADMDNLGRDDRLAFLINSYNAFTIKLLTEHYPLKSIKDIPAADRWDGVRWDLAGKTVSLNQIEHEYVRPNFKEPRIHFSLVCGAIGCPPLRNEAFNGETLETQLAGQSTYVHDHKTWFQYDAANNQVSLTKLYDWYGGDFKQLSGTIFEFIRTHSDKLQGVKDPSIAWLDYDWDLNDIKNKAPR